MTFPANGKARINNVKSFTSADDYERELIRLGMDREEAKAFLEGIYQTNQAKYTEAASRHVALNNLLSKLQGAK